MSAERSPRGSLVKSARRLSVYLHQLVLPPAGRPRVHSADALCVRRVSQPTAAVTPTEGAADAETPADEWVLTERECELLRRTWSDDFDFLYALGTDIYAYIFEHSPSARQLFPAVAAHGDQWRDSRQFREQALKFVQVLALAVKNTQHRDRVDALLCRVGAAHRQYARRGFTAEHWLIFRQALEHAFAAHIATLDTLADDERQQATLAWHKLADYVIKKMLRAFEDASP